MGMILEWLCDGTIVFFVAYFGWQIARAFTPAVALALVISLILVVVVGCWAK